MAFSASHLITGYIDFRVQVIRMPSALWSSHAIVLSSDGERKVIQGWRVSTGRGYQSAWCFFFATELSIYLIAASWCEGEQNTNVTQYYHRFGLVGRSPACGDTNWHFCRIMISVRAGAGGRHRLLWTYRQAVWGHL